MPSDRVARRAALVVPACVFACIHLLLPFRFPVPWPDETSFIAPALALARHGTLFVWGMNPDRVVMWMPPGYMILLAGLFKTFGYSFALARWVSAACAVLSAWLVLHIASTGTSGRRALLLYAAATLAFLSPYMLMSANMARMEQPLFLLGLLSLLAFLRGLPVLGTAIIVASAVVHFNAVFFLLPVLAFFGWALAAWRPLVVRPAELAGLAVAAALLAGYADFVGHNASGFVADMGMQFRLKAFATSLADPDYPVWPVLVAALPPLALAALRRGVDGPVMLSLYGLAFVLMANRGREIWYDGALPLGFLLSAIGVAQAIPQRGVLRPAFLACLAACLAGIVLTGFRPTPLLRSLLPRPAMLTHALLPPADLARMRGELARLPPGTKVFFAWIGVQPFFLDALDRAGVLWGAPQHSVTDATPDRVMEWRVQCDSPDTPETLWRFFPRETHGGSYTGCDLHRF